MLQTLRNQVKFWDNILKWKWWTPHVVDFKFHLQNSRNWGGKFKNLHKLFQKIITICKEYYVCLVLDKRIRMTFSTSTRYWKERMKKLVVFGGSFLCGTNQALCLHYWIRREFEIFFYNDIRANVIRFKRKKYYLVGLRTTTRMMSLLKKLSQTNDDADWNKIKEPFLD